MNPVPPSIRKAAFSCPHCSAYTTQYWFALYADQLDADLPLPFCPDYDYEVEVLRNRNLSDDQRRDVLKWIEKFKTKLVFLENGNKDTPEFRAWNLSLSKCYHCNKIAVWIHDRLLFPVSKFGVLPNPDLPDEILHDFEEAREIVNSSPRGAAALLRLCVQKLCKHLGGDGKNIDADIALLVSQGLNPLVQQSLDIVRVIGNEAVHPGVIDLKDDSDTATRLFELVNSIAEQMISHPKVVNSLYKQLPESKRQAIEARDKKALQSRSGDAQSSNAQ